MLSRKKPTRNAVEGEPRPCGELGSGEDTSVVRVLMDLLLTYLWNRWVGKRLPFTLHL